jgi:hypothetical protein
MMFSRCRDLERAYIPSCANCQRNKSHTTKPPGPLHPLPVPDKCFSSIAIDFVGPLPEDNGFNYLVTITDHLGADIKLIPCCSNIMAPEFARLFFDHWYCDNGAPTEIVSDRDHLFISTFWQTTMKLAGINHKLSSAHHPKADGASEKTNKTVIQALRFMVDRNQNGWVKALPRVLFDIMNTVNASTGFSGFQMKTGTSPRILPPFPPTVCNLGRTKCSP